MKRKVVPCLVVALWFTLHAGRLRAESNVGDPPDDIFGDSKAHARDEAAASADIWGTDLPPLQADPPVDLLAPSSNTLAGEDSSFSDGPGEKADLSHLLGIVENDNDKRILFHNDF